MDAQMFQAVAERYKDSIFRIALNYCKNRADADDITQNVLIRCYKSNKVFESEEHIRNWLIRVAINESKRWLCSPYRAFLANTVELDQAQLAQYDLEPEESRLYRAFMSLPAKYRIVLYMHYYEDYSASQIAQMIGSRVSTVTTRLSRGRACLRQALERCEENGRAGIVQKDV